MKNKQELVSIILNCYNGEKFLAEALLSLKNQTYKNWELIFWDNRSTDSSKEIVFSFKFKNLRYFLSKKHTTLYEARNLAIKKVKGKFICFIDADDLWEKDKIKNQLKLFKDKETAVVYGNSYLKNEKNNKIKKFINYEVSSGYIYKKLIKNYDIGILTTMIKRSFLKKSKIIFNKKYNIIGDFDFFINLSKNYKFQYISQPIATYRIHENNFSSINKNIQIQELQDWLNRNKNRLSLDEKKNFKSRIIQLKFIEKKFNTNFFKTFSFFVKQNRLLISLKNIFILIAPKIYLKKLIWFS